MAVSGHDQIEQLLKQGHVPRALKLAQLQARRQPKDARALDLLARCHLAAGDATRALASYDRLTRLRPRAPGPLADKALLLQQLGRAAEAERTLRKAIRLEPESGSLLRMLSATSRLGPDDPVVAPVLQAWKAGSLAPSDRVEAGFALFRIFERDGFDYLSEANHVQRRQNPWDIATRLREIAALKVAMSAGDWPDLTPPDTENRPIFVTGLPRSGTTLVEQILSSHPGVTAAGETGLMTRAAYSVLVDGNRFKPVSELPGDALALIGRRYLDAMSHFHRVGPIFTDKSIQTHLLIGLVRHVLPQARVIVVRRDPRDVGWSIYRNHFADGTHGYSNDLADIAAYIRSVDEMVGFWRDHAPGSFIEVNYEDLVRDPEPQIRTLLNHCGLDWDDACLHPERNPARVQTLSIDQVRAPISPKSIGGWRAYAAELKPLTDALGELVKPWD